MSFCLVPHSTPMMDLFITTCSMSKLKPADHLLTIISEETGRPVEYHSSQTISSLAVSRVYLISKAQQQQRRDSELQKQKSLGEFEVCSR